MANNNSQAAANASTTKEDRKFQLYKQLHEQFAVNDNNKISSFISFLAAIFSVFVGYGFSYHHYNIEHNSLTMVTIASLMILALVSTLCLFFGYSTRRDQFITHEIREKYDVELRYTNPFDRKANMWNFLPDYYSIMLYACIVFMILLTIATVLQLPPKDTNFFLVIAASVISLMVVICFMWFYYGKYKEFKDKYPQNSNLNVMNKNVSWKNVWYKFLTTVVVIFLVVILINILLFSFSHLEFGLYKKDDDFGIVKTDTLYSYLNVFGTLVLALMAAEAFRESLKMRERSSFNAVFTQLLSNHVAIFKDAAENNPISSSPRIKTNVFAHFYDYYKSNRAFPMGEKELKKLWKDYCNSIPDGIKFSHAFKYVFHEVKTVYDEYSANDPMRNHYIKIIQANMSQDELFCYLINLLQHYYKSKDKEQEKIGEYLMHLKESNFFEDLIREDGKYGPVICELQKDSDLKNKLELLLGDLSNLLPKRVIICGLDTYCNSKCPHF